MNRKAGPELQAHQLSQHCLALATTLLRQARAAGYIADYKPHELALYDQLIDNTERMADHINRL